MSAALDGLDWLEVAGFNFPATALSGPTGAELGPDAASRALAHYLADPVGEPPQQQGWRRLAETDDRVLFAAGDASDLDYVVFSRQGDGWPWDGSGMSTSAVPAAPTGFGVGTWALAGPVASDDRGFVALVSERGCASGRPPGDRVRPPLVKYASDSVTIRFIIESPKGFQTCPGAPATPVDVVLDEPLGRRALLDAGHYPPRLVRPSQD